MTDVGYHLDLHESLSNFAHHEHESLPNFAHYEHESLPNFTHYGHGAGAGAKLGNSSCP